MQFALKLIASNIVILLCVWIGKKHPSLGGLIATMPLTSLIVLLWLYSDNPADGRLLSSYVGGVFFGVIPTLLFFGAAWLCLKKRPAAPFDTRGQLCRLDRSCGYAPNCCSNRMSMFLLLLSLLLLGAPAPAAAVDALFAVAVTPAPVLNRA